MSELERRLKAAPERSATPPEPSHNHKRECSVCRVHHRRLRAHGAWRGHHPHRGTTSDAAAAPGLIGDELAGTGVLGDSAYGSGELRDHPEKEGKTAVIKLPPLRPAVVGGFDLDDFDIEEEAAT